MPRGVTCVNLVPKSQAYRTFSLCSAKLTLLAVYASLLKNALQPSNRDLPEVCVEHEAIEVHF